VIVHVVTRESEQEVVELATQPLSGGQGRYGIFAPRVATTKRIYKVMGVFTTAEEAQRTVAALLKENAQCRVNIQIASLDQLPAAALPPPPIHCADCGVEIYTGTYCGPCLKAVFQGIRDADPLGGAPEAGFEGKPAGSQALAQA